VKNRYIKPPPGNDMDTYHMWFAANIV